MSKRNHFNHARVNIDPFRFMQLDKPEILYKLTSELSYPEEDAHSEFYSMTGMLTLLKTIRYCQSQTDDYLKDAVPNLHPKVRITAILILLKATESDDTYCYAYNTFVYYTNRFLHLNLPRKIIAKADLLILLEAEKTPKAPVYPDQQTVTDNPFIFDEVFLNSFYLAFNNLLWEHTDIVSFLNWFRVTPIGKPEFKYNMTTYFCYAVSRIEDKIIKEYKPKNFNNWIKPVINGNNYSHMKNIRDNEDKITIIDNKLSLILNQESFYS